MEWLRKIRFRLGALFGRSRFNAEMEAEMRMHLELRIERNVAAGMAPEEARYAALREFGGLDQLKEKARDQRGGLWLGQMAQDLRYGLRLLRRSPGFTAIAVLTLALGIGACAAVFGVVNAVVLHPFSYPRVDRLMVLHGVDTSTGFQGTIAPGDFLDFRQESASFADLAASYSMGDNYIIGNEPIRLYTEYVTANLFTTLGARPFLGRAFRADEEVEGRGGVIVLGYSLWRNYFTGRRDVIGRTVLVGDKVATIIGVMPPDFQTFANPDFGPALYMPITDWSRVRQDRRLHSLHVIGRLKDDVTRAQAAREMEVIAGRLAHQYPDTDQGWGVSVIPLLDDAVAFARPLLLILLGAVGFLLLIACANIANLLLARAASRQKEIVVRTALGASRGRIVRQLLCESMILAVGGGALGVLFAHWGTKLIILILPADLPGSANVAVDGRTLVFTCTVVFLTGLGCGLAPALQSARVDLNRALKESGRGNSAGRPGLRLRSLFVIAEIALALILLTSAGLLVRSFVAYQRVDRGYQEKDLYGTPLALTQRQYDVPQNRINFVDQVTEKLSHLPGLSSAMLTNNGDPTRDFAIAGRPAAAPGSVPAAKFQVITPGYFKFMGIPLLHGRDFTAQDRTGGSPVALIDQALAQRYFPNQNPIGQRLKVIQEDGTLDEWKVIVGVMGTVRFDRDDPVHAIPDRIYVPYGQYPQPRDLWLGVRPLPGAPLDLRAISAGVHAVGADVPLTVMFGNRPEEKGVPGIRRLSMVLSSLFSGVALLLAAIGIYGVMAYNVTQRTGEIGVRMALGAQRGDVLQLILKNGAGIICCGILIGLLGGLASARLLGGLLFNVAAYDFVTFGGITAGIALIGLAACLLPALRATKVNPMAALRAE